MLSTVNAPSLKVGPRSLAVSVRVRSSASVNALLDDDDDEVVDELAELELVDEDTATLFFLPLSRPRSKNAPMANTATARTPTTIHFALLSGAVGGCGAAAGGATGGGAIGSVVG